MWEIKKGVSKEKVDEKWVDCCKTSGATPGESAFVCTALSKKQNVKIGGRRLKRGCTEADSRLTLVFEYDFVGTILVFDLKGNTVAVLQRNSDAPKSTIQWDARLQTGEFAEPGIYFVDVQTSGFSKRVSFAVLKGCK
jgi:hypothetical protein